MTDERKQATTIMLRRILSDYRRLNSYTIDDAVSDIYGIMEPDPALKVAETTKEMYPKEFLRWCIYDEELFYGELNEELITDNYGGFKSLDELFEYWKQNIRK